MVAIQWKSISILFALVNPGCLSSQTDKVKELACNADTRCGNEVVGAIHSQSLFGPGMQFSHMPADHTSMLQTVLSVDRGSERFWGAISDACDEEFEKKDALLKEKKEKPEDETKDEKILADHRDECKRMAEGEKAKHEPTWYNSTVGAITNASTSIINGPAQLLALGEELYGMLEKFKNMTSKLPEDLSIGNLMKVGAGGVDGQVEALVLPKLEQLKQAMADLAKPSEEPLIALPQQTCPSESDAGDKDKDWVGDALKKVEKLLTSLLDQPGMQLIKTGMDAVVDKVMNVLQAEIVPFLVNLINLVRSKVLAMLNKALGAVIGKPPNAKDLQAQIQQAGKSSMPPSLWAWLSIQITQAVDSAVKPTVDKVMAPQLAKLKALTSGKCTKPPPLADPVSLVDQADEVMTKTIDTVQEALITNLNAEIQKPILQFVSGVASMTDAMVSASSSVVSEIPIAGPLIGFVLDYLIQTFNSVLWVRYFPFLAGCKLTNILNTIGSKVTNLIRGAASKMKANAKEVVAKGKAAVAKGDAAVAKGKGEMAKLDLSALPADLKDSPIAAVLQWTYEQALPIIDKGLADGDSKMKGISAAMAGYQCVDKAKKEVKAEKCTDTCYEADTSKYTGTTKGFKKCTGYEKEDYKCDKDKKWCAACMDPAKPRGDVKDCAVAAKKGLSPDPTTGKCV